MAAMALVMASAACISVGLLVFVHLRLTRSCRREVDSLLQRSVADSCLDYLTMQTLTAMRDAARRAGR